MTIELATDPSKPLSNPVCFTSSTIQENLDPIWNEGGSWKSSWHLVCDLTVPPLLLEFAVDVQGATHIMVAVWDKDEAKSVKSVFSSLTKVAC